MLDRLRSNHVTWFLIKTAVLLVTWFVLYEYVLNPAQVLDRPLISNLILMTGLLLKLFGYTPIEQVFDNMRTIGVDGTNGVWIGDSCDGISLFVVFAIIIICFPGPARVKCWFIPAGILILHLLNIIRITILSVMLLYSPDVMNFNHTYTFQILMYACIFALWLRWINKYSGLSLNKKNRT